MGLLDRVTFKQPPAAPPEAIDVTADHAFRIAWPGGAVATVAAKALRDACPCAGCIEEGTGRKILDPASIPDDIRAEGIEPVGNYAIKISWSDGHSTGLYTWQLLRDLCGVA